MFTRLVVLCLILMSASLNSAYASHYYKGELAYKSRTYKGELPAHPLPPVKASPSPACDFVPCITYTISPGPYLGFNPGLRTNYNNTSSVYKAFEGTVYAGYAMLNSSFYLASELFFQFGTELQNYRHNLNVNLNPIGLKTTWGTGLSILPGFILADPLMGYLRFGGVLTHFQDAGETATGGEIGIGLEGSVSESWDLRAEYVYSFYQSVSRLGAPRSDQFRLGFLYKLWS